MYVRCIFLKATERANIKLGTVDLHFVKSLIRSSKRHDHVVAKDIFLKLTFLDRGQLFFSNENQPPIYHLITNFCLGLE